MEVEDKEKIITELNVQSQEEEDLDFEESWIAGDIRGENCEFVLPEMSSL